VENEPEQEPHCVAALGSGFAKMIWLLAAPKLSLIVNLIKTIIIFLFI
jgi:hypothetical protein